MTATNRAPARKLTALQKADEFGRLARAISEQLENRSPGFSPPPGDWTFEVMRSGIVKITCDKAYDGPLKAWHKLIESEWGMQTTPSPTRLTVHFTRRA